MKYKTSGAIFIFTACLMCGLAAIQIKAAAGNLDLIVNTSFGTSSVDWAGAMAIQTDGKIVSAGETDNKFALTRHHPNGTLDTTFGSDGRVATLIDGYIRRIALQTDGKIVAAGYDYVGSGFILARFNSDGSLDTTFGLGGVITLVFDGFPSALALDLVIQADGKIVTAGRAVGDVSGDGNRFALARFNIDGSLDGSFGEDGKITEDFNGNNATAYAVAVQADGKIIAAGTAQGTFALARYNTDGSLDLTFDGDGKVTTTFPYTTIVNDIAIQADGKIVAAGQGQYLGNAAGRFVLARYNTNGSLDTGFGNNGRVATVVGGGINSSGGINSVAIQVDGKIIAGGTGGYSDFCYDEYLSSLIRYNSNGSLDTTFGSGGIVTISFLDENGFCDNNFLNDLAIQSDGKIVTAGSRADIRNGGDYDFQLLRFLGNPVKTNFDFDGDGRADISVFRPNLGEWWYRQNSNAETRAAQFGSSTDKITPADFDGDGRTDIAVWRDSTGEWFILRSDDGSYYSYPFGTSGDIPSVGDFDADGRADTAVFRPGSGTWFIRRSSDGAVFIRQFGQPGDVPVAADYDGDGRSDLAVYRPSTGEWWINRSSAGTVAVQFGTGTDTPVAGDYTGDGKSDVAVFRPQTGEWFILRSENQSYYSFPFGISTDTPAPADYDGDGKADAAVFRDGTWYLRQSTSGVSIQQFGLANDKPVPAAYLP